MMHKTYNFSNKDKPSIYVCPDCLRTTSIYSSQVNYFDIDNNQDLEDLYIGIQVDHPIFCKHCGRMMFKCDSTFADRILKLHLNGFITFSHCEGYPVTVIKMPDMIEENRTILPYLAFNFNQMSEINRNLVINTIHESGVVQCNDDLGDDLISIHPILEDCELLDYDTKVKFIEDARNQLYSFVDLLLSHIDE